MNTHFKNVLSKILHNIIIINYRMNINLSTLKIDYQFILK